MTEAFCNYYGRLENVERKSDMHHMVLDDYIMNSIAKAEEKLKKDVAKLLKTLKKDAEEDIRVIKKKLETINMRLVDLEDVTGIKKKGKKKGKKKIIEETIE